MIGDVGLSPDEFWSNTLKHNTLLAKSHETKSELAFVRARNIEFSNYATAFGFDGKKIYKDINYPKDLYALPSDKNIKREEVVIDLERALAAREGRLSNDIKKDPKLSSVLKQFSK